MEFQAEEIKTIWKLSGKRSTTKDTSKKKNDHRMMGIAPLNFFPLFVEAVPSRQQPGENTQLYYDLWSQNGNVIRLPSEFE